MDDILTEIKHKTGLHIPLEAARGYQDLAGVDCSSAGLRAKQGPSLENQHQDMRLHAVTWSLPETNEWSLLFVLGAVPGGKPPYGVKLQIRDETDLLGEKVLEPDGGGAYLYAQVDGEVGETFEVSISSTTTEPLTFPFTYSG